jgi:hypothetical protein
VSPEDMQRFEIEAAPGRAVLVSCTRCRDWEDIIADRHWDAEPPLTLAELVQRAGAHTEVCG